jgi:quinol monooxygenase YgiN
MIIVAGHLQVAPDHRTDYLDGCREVVRLARTTSGCLDFALSADPFEPGRVNIFERWETIEDVEAFRGDGPEGPDAEAIISAHVEQYEIRTRLRL